MKIASTIIVLALLVLQPSFGQSMEKTATQVPNDWKELKGDNYWLIYPEDWELNTSGQMGSTFALLSPVSSSKDKFRENVNFMIQDLSGYNMNLEAFAKVSEEQVKTLVTDGELIESTLIVGNTLNHQKTIFTGKQGIFNLIFEQHYWVENDKAFILSFTCEESQHEKYKEVGAKILNSFQLFIR